MSGAPPGALGAAQLRRVLAPNPGPMTLEGTNTWVLLRPDLDEGHRAVVIDPGPDDADHRAAVLAAAGGSLSLVLTTHHHADHAEGVTTLAAATGARVLLAADLAGAAARAQVLRTAGLHVVAAAGHTADSVAFWLPSGTLHGAPAGPLVEGSAPGDDGGRAGDDPDPPAVLLSGDTVLGRGPSVIDAGAGGGDLTAHLDTLRRLLALVRTSPGAHLAPGHGPVGGSASALIGAQVLHRTQRLEQVGRAVAAGARTPAQVVDAVYPGLDPGLRSAAERSAAAALVHGRAHLDWPVDVGGAD